MPGHVKEIVRDKFRLKVPFLAIAFIAGSQAALSTILRCDLSIRGCELLNARSRSPQLPFQRSHTYEDHRRSEALPP
ncbi:hypothetical protein DFJ43DRAFT_1105333 [Lentinula guzmanii]|uniref:Uncharacterized protein n=1 Tax=Lentinula guzmanii TaxID=2804957 RepID=A0AA38J3D8_9AGAR|nr:hypothetical protein DFJ43DRAFT_1105333 [Lentinula guzmanii]